MVVGRGLGPGDWILNIINQTNHRLISPQDSKLSSNLINKHGDNLEDKSLTICSGTDYININYQHVVCPDAATAKVSIVTNFIFVFSIKLMFVFLNGNISWLTYLILFIHLFCTERWDFLHFENNRRFIKRNPRNLDGQNTKVFLVLAGNNSLIYPRCSNPISSIKRTTTNH